MYMYFFFDEKLNKHEKKRKIIISTSYEFQIVLTNMQGPPPPAGFLVGDLYFD
jgi:hypothetical protein